MMRSLWTAASGMTAQQQNVDTISHNLANVNTYGYKKERMEFKTLLYETMQRADLDPVNTPSRPVNLQVGHGVRPIATARIFSMGNLETTYNNTDFAIDGEGFFAVRRSLDDIKYTRDGAFKLSVTDDGLMFTTAEGYPILGIDDEPIIIPPEIQISSVKVDEEGVVYYTDAEGATIESGFQINMVQFPNSKGLEAVGSNLFSETIASGAPMYESDGEVTKPSRLLQTVLEMSNVQVAEEMINLIVAQRAYELNSKAIQTSDDMLQQANNLKR